MPIAVVLPGLDGTGSLLSDFATSLGRHFAVQVVAYPPDQRLDYTQLREFVRARLPDDAFVLIAESFSGPIALSLAREQLPGLKALVLCASFARVDLPAKAWLSRCAPILPLRHLPTPLLSIVLWGEWRNRERTQALAEALSQVAPEVLRTRALEALRVDVAHEAPLRVPLLYLQASRDRLIRDSAARVVGGMCPNARIERLDAPHFLLQIRPGECADAIAAFALEVDTRS